MRQMPCPSARVSVIVLLASLLPVVAGAQPAAEPPVEGQPVPAAAEGATPVAEPPATAPATPPLSERLGAMLGRPGGLTAEVAAQRAGETSRQAEVAAQDVEAANALVDKATVTAFPRLNLIARYTRLSPIESQSLGFGGSGTLVATADGAQGLLPPTQQYLGIQVPEFSFPTPLNQYHLQAGVTVPLSDYLFRTPQAISAAKHSRAGAALKVRAERLAASAQARLVYYDWVRTQLEQVVTEQSLAQSREQQRITELAFQAGRLSKADILRVQSQVALHELTVEQARNAVRLAEDRLRVIMHDESGRPYQIGDDVVAQARRPDRDEDFERLLAEAYRRRLELRALDATARSLEQQRQVLVAGNLPRLEAFGNAYYANPHQRYFPQQEEWHASWDVGLQATWSPNDVGVAGADSRQFAAQRAQVEAQRRAVKDGLRAEVLTALQIQREARIALGTSERSLAAAEEGYRVRARLFEYGRATQLEVMDAETLLLQARITLIRTEVALLMARAQLEHAVGRDVR